MGLRPLKAKFLEVPLSENDSTTGNDLAFTGGQNGDETILGF
jgi:hypothetical protein